MGQRCAEFRVTTGGGSVQRVWPFEGRDRELSQIGSALRGSGPGAVMLGGPAGMGKTRLARQALTDLDGVRTTWIGATRAAVAIPCGAIAPLLPDDAPVGGSLVLMRAAARRVAGWGGRHRAVIVVDDAHLLDDASSTVIAHLVTNRLAFVILTVRTGEPVPDVLTQLCRDGHAQRIELVPLPAATVDRLIDHAAPEHLTARRRRRLHEAARGNPLALRELLYGAEPGGLIELVTSRLNSLDSGTRYAVELVACGEPLAVNVLERLAGLPALVSAEDSGLIVVERSGARLQARLDHPLYGEVLPGTMRLSRTTRVYRALAGAVLETPLRRRDDILRAALWQVEGGTVSRPDVVRAGAWQAVGHADLELAERMARAARTAEPGDEADRLLAEILAYRGRTEEATQVLPTTQPEDPEDRVAWAVTRAEALYWNSGDIGSAQAALDLAAGHQVAEASRSWLLVFDARCADAARVARGVLADDDAEPKAVIWAAAAGSAATGFLGGLDEAQAVHRRGAAVAAAHAGDVPWGVVEVETAACLAHLACGQPAAAQSITADGYRTAMNGGAAMMVSGWALYGGLAALARGHVEDADRLLAEALTGFESNDTFRLARCALAARAAVTALRGDPDAGVLMNRADCLAHPSNKLFAPWIETWRAWTAYANGDDLAAAAAFATAAADLARDAAMPGIEALARYDLARLGARPDLARLDAIDHDLATLLADAARALAAQDGASRLESAARSFAARGYDLHAAEAYATAAGRHRRHGRMAQAELARAYGARLAARLPHARTPLLQSGDLTSLLTWREHGILLLAAEHTSVQIAERLGLAVATVNNNLARAYAKLGITGRAQLRELLASADNGTARNGGSDPQRC
jgi:DNA-binding CsgD family transcriptional regulator